MTTDPIPSVRLAGRDYPVPPLVPSQQRIVLPALWRVMHVASDKMTTEHYDDLLRIVYFGAVKKADPVRKFEELFELPITGDELLAAVRIVKEQTGFFKKTPPGDPAPGESKAGANPPA